MAADDEPFDVHIARVRRLLDTPAVHRARATLAATNRAFIEVYTATAEGPGDERSAAASAVAAALRDAVVGLLRAHEASGVPDWGLWILHVGAAVGPRPDEPPAESEFRARVAVAATAVAWAGIEAVGAAAPGSSC
jgi:hypothetical protein